jgi:hypothetical protein
MEAQYVIGLLALVLVLSVAVLVRQIRMQWALRKLLLRMLNRWRKLHGN